MTAGEKEYFASQEGSTIVFLSAISISVVDLRSSDSKNYVFSAADRPSRVSDAAGRDGGVWGQKKHRYSITSSARASSVGGTSMPSALAVLRLITSSNVVGC